jgi:glucosamine--fructose-6-phosphate aminotransferase (isomerizing)
VDKKHEVLTWEQRVSGIVGYIGSEDAAKILVDALKKLEYRGYDSCGIAVMTGKTVDIRKEVGGIKNLEELLQKRPLAGNVGIGHTRWASHGKVSLDNAHPQVAGDITLVHNGIIDNYLSLRERLTLGNNARKFVSDTDTEVLAHLIDFQFKESLEEAVCLALKDIEGTYALAALSPRDPEKIVVATKEFSIVIGLGAGKFIFASDVIAILPYTRDVIFLGEQEIAVLTKEGVSILDKEGKIVYSTSGSCTDEKIEEIENILVE